jgi:hypothetical protein
MNRIALTLKEERPVHIDPIMDKRSAMGLYKSIDLLIFGRSR